MKSKRVLSVVLALLLCVMLSACTGGTTSDPTATPTSGSTATPASTATATPEEGGNTSEEGPTADAAYTWPLTDEKISFSVFASNGGTIIEDLETNGFTIWYEEQTNVHIDWQIVTSGASTQIPLIIAGGDYPDIFFGNLSDVQIQTYALLDKVFVPITDYIFDNAPNVVKMLEESAEARQYSYLPDGEIYALLRVVDTYNESITKRAWVYEPWLETLGIDLPETTDEFYDMLVRFRDEDPNGNGIADEVPFAGALLNNPSNNEPEGYILNAFMYYDSSTFLEVLDDGTLKFVADTEAYRDGLRYLNKLYNENLLVKDTWTIDRKGLLAMTEGGDVNTLGSVAAMYWGHFTTENGPVGRDQEFVAIPALEGPDGVRNAYDRGMLINNGKIVCTTKCENIDILMQWADWFFDADGMMESGYSAMYGPENVGWRYAEEGELTGEGKQATYAYLRAIDGKQNDNWFMTQPYYESSDYIMSIVDNEYNRKESFGSVETLNKYKPYSALAKKVPFLYASLENQEEYTTLKNSLQNSTTGEVNVYRNRFITGELSLDTDWDAYVNMLQKLGVERYVELYQEMYDAYLAVQASGGY